MDRSTLSVFVAALAVLLFLQSAGAEEKAAIKCTITQGPGGPPRPAKLVVCEYVFVQGEMSGIAHDAAGKVDISYSLEVLDHDGKVVQSQPWQRANREYSPSAIRSVYAFQLATKGDKEKAGKYTCRLHLHDHIADTKVHGDAPFELVPPDDLTAYDLRCGHDPTGSGYAGASFAVGELIYIHGNFTSFSTENRRMKCRMVLNILDGNGKPLGWKEVALSANREIGKYEEFSREGFEFHFQSWQAGRFIAAVRIEDLVSGKETTEYVPFLVNDVSSLQVPDSLRTANKPVDGAEKR
jgi:hypothetical protein